MKWMRSVLVGTVFLLLVLAFPVQGQVVDVRAALDDMGAWMQQYRIPGAVVVYADEAGESWVRTFGYADYARRDLVTAGTYIPFGSITQIFSTMAILAEWDAAGRALSAPITDWVPQGLQPRGNGALTLETLLRHTSGIDSTPFFLGGFAAKDNPLLASLQAHWNGYVARPGQARRVSSLNLGLAALVVSEASGQPFGQIMAQWLLEPAELEAMGFGRVVPPDARSALVPHRHTELGYIPFPSYETSNYPALGLYGSVSQVEQLLRWVLEDNPLHQYLMDDPELVGLFPLQHPGLGALGRLSQTPGAASGLWYIPRDGALVFVAVNGEDGHLLLRDLWGSSVAEPAAAAELPDSRELRRFTGSYLSDAVPQNGVEKVGPLFGSTVPINIGRGQEYALTLRMGNYEEELIFVRSQLFLGVDSGSLVRFLVDDNDRITGLVHDGAPQQTLERLAWWQRIDVRRALWVGMLVILIIEVFAPWLLPARRRRRPDPENYLLARRITAWLFGLAFVVAAAAMLNMQLHQLPLGLSSGLVWARRLLWPAFVSLAIFWVIVIMHWVQAQLPTGRKVSYTLVALFYTLLSAYCFVYNLPGW